MLVGRTKPVAPNTWIAAPLKAEADALLAEHQAKVAEFDERIKLKKQENDALKERYKSDSNFGTWRDAMIANEELHQRPTVTVEPLLRSLPHASKFQRSKSGDPEKLARAATTAIAASGWAPSRDGLYTCILPGGTSRPTLGLVSWIPYSGTSAYPEVRWAVQRRLPQALCKPRLVDVRPPEFEFGTRPPEQPTDIVKGLDVAGQDWLNATEDIQLDQNDYRQRVDESRKDRQEQGFDAIAWFQPYHSFAEEAWGIYVDASKLDDLALSLLDDFKSHHVHGSHSDAARIAFGLIYAHELFHARVEAAMSWLEINALQPRFLRYKQRVYDALREKPEWLEEALANWTSWNWFQSAPVQALFARRKANLDGLRKVVGTSLDLSPPGYRDWRMGHQPITWRTFTTQLSTGQAKSTASAMGLPLESMLLGPLPYDFRASDIPLRFVGSGVISYRLQSQPATFNVPTRRELEKALKFFKHILDVSGGKGGHQKWTGPDQRAFILPTRDPVSVGVFNTFLQHLGIDKATYVREVRPNL